MTDQIAIIGMALRFPGADSAEALWNNLCGGIESISRFTQAELLESCVEPRISSDPAYVLAGGIIEGIEFFDAAFFDMSPREAEITDPQQRIFLQCAWHAFENAGYDPLRYPGPVGVFAGSSRNGYVDLCRAGEHPEPTRSDFNDLQWQLGNEKDHIATRTSYKLNLRGPAVTAQTACSTSLVCVHLAVRSLIAHECDMALAGASAIQIPQKRGYWFRPGGISSPDGHCRPFDETANGTVRSNGAGVVVLKRLREAVRDGDTIHGIIAGSAINNDGRSKAGYTAPSAAGQAEVIYRAQQSAGISAEEVGFVEGHGTATALGDPIEVAGLTRAFRKTTDQLAFCALGSLKGNIGHLDAASGIAGLIKTILVLKHGFIPQTLHFKTPNPALNLTEGPFFINSTVVPWAHKGTTRIGAVSSFGMGGTNAHVILRQYRSPSRQTRDRGTYALMVSARTEEALRDSTKLLEAALATNPTGKLSDVEFTLRCGRAHLRHRRTVVCQDRKEALQALRDDVAPAGFSDVSRFPETGSIVLAFCDEQSPRIDAAAALYSREQVFRETFDSCSMTAGRVAGWNLREMLFSRHRPVNASSRLLNTAKGSEVTSFAIQYALARLFSSKGVAPAKMIGSGVGEYVVACLAGVLSVEAAVDLLSTRGGLVDTTKAGGALFVEADAGRLGSFLREDLSIATIYGEGLTAISGPSRPLNALRRLLAEMGFVTHSGERVCRAYSSSVMDSILPRFGAALHQAELRPPAAPYLSALTGKWSTASVATAEYWCKHLRESNRFDLALQALPTDTKALLLVGSISPVVSLVKNCLAPMGVVVEALELRGGFSSQLRSWTNVLAALWTVGVDVKWDRAPGTKRIELPGYPFRKTRCWSAGANHDIQGEPTQSERPPDTSRWVYTPIWQKHSLPGLPGGIRGQQEHWLLAGDGGPFNNVLASRLRMEGHTATDLSFAGGQTFPPEGGAGYGATHFPDVFDQRCQSKTPDHLVYFRTGEICWNDASPDTFDDHLREAVALIYVIQAMAERWRDSLRSFTLITTGAAIVDGTEAVCPVRASLSSVCVVGSQEFPRIRWRHIDIGEKDIDSHETATMILLELRRDAADVLLAFRASSSWSLRYVPATPNSNVPLNSSIVKEGVYLITGGLGHIGLAIAQYLAEVHQARVALVGRHSPTGDQRSKIQGIRAPAKNLLVLTADIAVPSDLRKALRNIRENLGPINGVFHSAGETSGRSFRTITLIEPEDLAAQFWGKAIGVSRLQAALRNDPVQLWVLNSSLAAVLGGVELCGYAAANRFLDIFARMQDGNRGSRWISINWDGWSGGNPASGQKWRVHQDAINTRDGIALLNGICESRLGPEIIVSTADLDLRIQQNERKRRRFATESSVPFLPSDDLNMVVRALCQVWAEILGLERVAATDDFLAIGGDSLIALQVVERLHADMGVDISLNTFFRAGTPERLGRAVVQQGLTGQEREDELANSHVLADNLQADLRRSIHKMTEISQVPADSRTEPNGAGFLITGATGCIGRHLTHQLLMSTDVPVYCLVRGVTQEAARCALEERLEAIGVAPELLSRLRVLVGDIRNDNFGLNRRELDEISGLSVIHAAAEVNFLFSYHSLRSTNVDATVNLIRWAAANPGTALHVISSRGVYVNCPAEGGGEIFEADSLFGTPPVQGSGYLQTKWVSDCIATSARANGHNVSIYRLPWLSSTFDGVCNPRDLLWEVLRLCIDCRSAPDLHGRVALCLIETAASVVGSLVTQAGAPRTFNIWTTHSIEWRDLIETLKEMGYPMILVGPEQWKADVRDFASSDAVRGTRAKAIVAMFWNGLGGMFGSPKVSCRNVEQLVGEPRDSGVSSRSLISRCVAHLRETGYWPLCM